MPMKYIILLILCAASMKAACQNIQTSNLRWVVSGITDLNSSASNAGYSCSFKTSGKNSITWEQNRGYTVTFIVTGVDGIWDDINNPGRVVYSVTFNGNSGTITFEKATSGTSVTMNLSQKSSNPLSLKYSVSQVTNP